MLSSNYEFKKPRINPEIMQKILGDSFHYVHENLSAQQLSNIHTILLKTQEKYAHMTNEKGIISPKVVKRLVSEGSYINDKVAVDYYAGIIASSRSKLGRDDRGSYMAKLIDQLSFYQLRSHFLIYSTIKSKFKEMNYAFDFNGCEKMEIFLPIFFYAKAMKMNKDEFNQIDNLITHCFKGLADMQLIDKNYYFGYPEHHHEYYKGFDFDGVICQPTTSGVQFFLWAFGAGDKNPEYLFHKDFKPKIKGLPGSIPHILYTNMSS